MMMMMTCCCVCVSASTRNARYRAALVAVCLSTRSWMQSLKLVRLLLLLRQLRRDAGFHRSMSAGVKFHATAATVVVTALMPSSSSTFVLYAAGVNSLRSSWFFCVDCFSLCQGGQSSETETARQIRLLHAIESTLYVTRTVSQQTQQKSKTVLTL